jgi:hypothetical protein
MKSKKKAVILTKRQGQLLLGNLKIARDKRIISEIKSLKNSNHN